MSAVVFAVLLLLRLLLLMRLLLLFLLLNVRSESGRKFKQPLRL